MASIVKRKSKYSVVYDYTDENGKRRQRWETFSTNAEAKKRKKQIEYESVFSLCPSHRCFIADLVRFFRGDFSRLKGLAYLVCDDIVLLLSAGNMLILPFGKQKFLICCLWITLIGTDKFAIIGFCGIL